MSDYDTESVFLKDDWLDGVRAAADWAHDNIGDAFADDIINAVIADRVRKAAGW